MSGVLENGFIEKLINDNESYGKVTSKVINQYIVLDLVEKISKEIFNSYGEVLSYRFKKELLSEEMRTDIKCKNYHMSISYMVIKKEDEKFILKIDNIKDDVPMINVTNSMGYMYKNTLYIPEYVENHDFEKRLRNTGASFANRVHINLMKDLYSMIVSVFDEIKNTDDFKVKAEERVVDYIDLDMKENKGKLIKESIESFAKEDGSFLAKDINSSIYLNVFEGENKDKILKYIGYGIVDGKYKDITKNISEYVKDKSKYIENIKKEHKDEIVAVLIKEYSKCLSKKRIIDDSKDVFKGYEVLCRYNKEIVDILDKIKDIVRENNCKKFEIIFPDSDEKYKVSSTLECVNMPISCVGIDFKMLEIVGKINSKLDGKKTIIGANNIRPVVIKYRGKEVWKLESVVTNSLKCLNRKLMDYDFNLKYKNRWYLKWR